MNTKQSKNFSALWDYSISIQSGEMSLAEAQAQSKLDAAAYAKQKRADGFKVRRSTLRNQVRQYWRQGFPCGYSCTCYIVDVMRKSEGTFTTYRGKAAKQMAARFGHIVKGLQSITTCIQNGEEIPSTAVYYEGGKQTIGSVK